MGDIREDIIFKCGVDGKPFKLVPGKYSLYYRCPDYEFSQRGTGKEVCMNRLSFREAGMLTREIEKLRDEGMLAKGETGRIPGFMYEVAEVDDGYIAVYVVNTSKIKINGGGYRWES